MSRRADRLAAQAQLEADECRDQAERREYATHTRTRVWCSAALGRACDYWRDTDGVYRCCYCCRLSLRSALRDAGL